MLGKSTKKGRRIYRSENGRSANRGRQPSENHVEDWLNQTIGQEFAARKDGGGSGGGIVGEIDENRGTDGKRVRCEPAKRSGQN